LAFVASEWSPESEPHPVGGGAAHTRRAAVENMGVDHRGADVTVTEEFARAPPGSSLAVAERREAGFEESLVPAD